MLQELENHLSYSRCVCPIQYIEDGYINGICVAHGGRLLVDGLTVEAHRKKIAAGNGERKSYRWLYALAVIVSFALFFFFLI